LWARIAGRAGRTRDAGFTGDLGMLLAIPVDTLLDDSPWIIWVPDRALECHCRDLQEAE
jgi:hypothetical protein